VVSELGIRLSLEFVGNARVGLKHSFQPLASVASTRDEYGISQITRAVGPSYLYFELSFGLQQKRLNKRTWQIVKESDYG
jgi:hypothetical protein